nr:MAG: hypothetical protein J07AB56_11170 [Candidatus Nanosalinarum sp. J07AB56]
METDASPASIKVRSTDVAFSSEAPAINSDMAVRNPKKTTVPPLVGSDGLLSFCWSTPRIPE